MATNQEAAAELAALKAQLVKASAEITAKIQALVDAAANAGDAGDAASAFGATPLSIAHVFGPTSPQPALSA